MPRTLSRVSFGCFGNASASCKIAERSGRRKESLCLDCCPCNPDRWTRQDQTDHQTTKGSPQPPCFNKEILSLRQVCSCYRQLILHAYQTPFFLTSLFLLFTTCLYPHLLSTVSVFCTHHLLPSSSLLIDTQHTIVPPLALRASCNSPHLQHHSCRNVGKTPVTQECYEKKCETLNK